MVNSYISYTLNVYICGQEMCGPFSCIRRPAPNVRRIVTLKVTVTITKSQPDDVMRASRLAPPRVRRHFLDPLKFVDFPVGYARIRYLTTSSLRRVGLNALKSLQASLTPPCFLNILVFPLAYISLALCNTVAVKNEQGL